MLDMYIYTHKTQAVSPPFSAKLYEVNILP